MATPAKEAAASPDSWCYTDLKVVNFLYQWTIKNLEFRCNSGDEEVVESPPFSCGPEHRPLQWKLKLTVPSSTGSYVCIALVKLTQATVRTRCKFSILGRNRKILHATGWYNLVSRASETIHARDVPSGTSTGTVYKSQLFDQAKGYLPDGNLTILCEVSVHDVNNVVSVSGSQSQWVQECSLGQQLGSLLETAVLSDVTLVAGDKEFKAHKAILSARSPVFKAMFQHDTKENKENRVQISDSYPEVVKEMLTFIYSGEAPNLKALAHDVFIIADKYQLERLKQLCEKTLWEEIGVKNAANTLLLALTHNCVHLKKSCIQFITAHISEVLKTEGWRRFKDVNEALADTFQTLAELERMDVNQDL